MTKEQLKQLSNNAFPDNEQGLIDPVEHREFNDKLIDFVETPPDLESLVEHVVEGLFWPDRDGVKRQVYEQTIIVDIPYNGLPRFSTTLISGVYDYEIVKSSVLYIGEGIQVVKPFQFIDTYFEELGYNLADTDPSYTFDCINGNLIMTTSTLNWIISNRYRALSTIRWTKKN